MFQGLSVSVCVRERERERSLPVNNLSNLRSKFFNLKARSGFYLKKKKIEETEENIDMVKVWHTSLGLREIRAVSAKRGTSGGWREARIPGAVEHFRILILETGSEFKLVEMKIWGFNDGSDEAPLSKRRAPLAISKREVLHCGSIFTCIVLEKYPPQN